MIRFPAEWEPQSAVLIAWPKSAGDFSKHLDAVEKTYAIIAETISRRQKLLIVCNNPHHREHIQAKLANNPNIHFLLADTNDIWVRDTVFLTVATGSGYKLLNFRFNGWGNKYPHEKDNALNENLLPQFPAYNAAVEAIDFVLEGGSIESDGEGSILTTRHCLLNPNRNPDFDEAAIEQVLADHLGATRVLWLDQPNLAGDDTDAHIDTLARFCSPSTIAYTSCDDNEDPHYTSLKHMEKQLENLRDKEGKPYKLYNLPLPSPVYNEDGERLPANYANFLVINGAVLAPIYNDPMDNIALAQLRSCFPDHEVIPIPCRSLVHQYGSLHCMTMQFPAQVFR